MTKSKPNILLIADVPGWAFEIICRALQHHLSDYYNISIVFENQLNMIDLRHFDLIHLHSSWKHGLVQRLPREKLVTTIHSFFEIDHIYPANYLEQLCDKFAGVSVVCKGLQEYVQHYVPRVALTSAGVDTVRFYPIEKDRTSEFRVGWSGSLNNHYGNARVQELLLPAVKKVGCKIELASREERFVPHRQMPDFYHEIDCYICTSRSEGHPLGVLEAASCGIPVISTPVGIIPELIEHGHNGFIVDANVDSIAHAIALLRENPSLAASIGRAIRRTIINEWSWKVRSRGFARFYDSLLHETVHSSRKKNIQWWIDHGGSEWCEEIKRRDKEHGYYSRQEAMDVAFFKENVPTDASVLEIGCGYGRMFKKIKAGHRGLIFGLDRSLKMLLQAKMYVKSCNANRFILADARQLPLADNCVDFVYTAEFLIHVDLQDIKLVIRELLRVSRKGILHIENSSVSESRFANNWHDGCWVHDYKALYRKRGYQIRTIHRETLRQDIYFIQLERIQQSNKKQKYPGPGIRPCDDDVKVVRRDNPHIKSALSDKKNGSTKLPLLSIIIPFRQREIWRINNCLFSLRSQTRHSRIPSPEIIVVDYSPEINDLKLLACVAKYGAKYIGYQTEAVWNRSHALNIGIRQSSGSFVLCTDADIIFHHEFLKTVYFYIRDNAEDIFIISSVNTLPAGLVHGAIDPLKEFKVLSEKSKPLDVLATGACQLTTRHWLDKIRGYDQKFIWWGGEDDDMYFRAMVDGLKIVNVTEQTCLLHQWHPSVWHLPENKDKLHLHTGNVRYLAHVQKIKSVLRNDCDWGK